MVTGKIFDLSTILPQRVGLALDGIMAAPKGRLSHPVVVKQKLLETNVQ
jgi:hypothetical protein